MPGSRRPLTIGIDARAATEVPAGRGRVVRELLKEMARRDEDNRYVLYGREPWEEPLDERFEWSCRPWPDGPWHLWSALAARRRGCDAFLATNSYLSVVFGLVPTVAIVHDLMVFEAGTGAPKVSIAVERCTLGPAVRRARRLVCVSRATADALEARFPAAVHKTTVAPLGVAPSLSAPDPDELELLPAPGFVLTVGTLEPRKNLPRLVDAYSQLPATLRAEHPLVIVGAQGWHTGPTLAAINSLGGQCRRLGHVSDAALGELYRRCALFCYVSLGEGFGLPVLEAMAAGAAVLTSDVSSLPEVGGDAVEYADPRSTRDITVALQRMLDDPDRQSVLSRLGQDRAASFTWAATAEILLGELTRAAAFTRPARG